MKQGIAASWLGERQAEFRRFVWHPYIPHKDKVICNRFEIQFIIIQIYTIHET